MLPLRPVVLGLLVVVLNVTINGYDLLADPLGWLLVLAGARALPVRRRGLLLGSAALALVAAAVVWPPGVAEQVAETDDSLSWALSLPQSAFLLLLADGLRDAVRRAGPAGDPGLATWWTTTTALAGAALVLPVLVLGGDLVALGAIAALVSLVTVVLVLVLGLASARATWAGAAPAAGADDPPDGGPGPQR